MSLNTIENGIFRVSHILSPAQSNAQQRLGTPLLVQRLIETATANADAGGYGASLLSQRGHSWVLSRLSIEMTRYPHIHEQYGFRTWVRTLNRRFSERCFDILASDKVVGHARTIWGAIDMQQRKGVDLNDVIALDPPIRTDLDIPVSAAPRLSMPPEPEHSYEYTCRVTDLDFNRHMTTVRYIELLVGQFTLNELDTHLIGRMDVNFVREAREGDRLRVCWTGTPDQRICALTSADGSLIYATASLRLDPGTPPAI